MNSNNQSSSIDISLPDLWSEYAEAGYEKLYKGYSFRKILKVMDQLFEETNGGVVLDGGCGTGSLFDSIIHKIKPRVIVATDWSEKMLEKARKHSTKLLKEYNEKITFRFEKSDLSKEFPYPNDTFDAEVFNISICYLPFINGWKHSLKEAFRTVKPGSFVYVSTFLKGFDFKNMMKRYKLKALKEILASPLGVVHSIKLKKYPAKITEVARVQGMEYPDKKDLDDFLKSEVRFIKRGEEEIFWGMGIALKLQKSLNQ